MGKMEIWKNKNLAKWKFGDKKFGKKEIWKNGNLEIWNNGNS